MNIFGTEHEFVHISGVQINKVFLYIKIIIFFQQLEKMFTV